MARRTLRITPERQAEYDASYAAYGDAVLREKLEACQQVINEYQAEVERQALELETARLRVHNLTAERNALRREMETREQLVLGGKYAAELARLRRENEGLTVALNGLRADFESSRAAARERDAVTDRLRRELAVMTQKRNELQEELLGTRGELEEQRDALRRELAVMTAARDGLRRDLSIAARALENERSNANTLAQEADRLRADLAAREAERDQLHDLLIETRRELAKARGEGSNNA